MKRNLHLISDFNITPLARALAANALPELGEVTVAPYGQVHQTLLAAGLPDSIAVVWTRPEGVIESYQQAIDLAEIDHALVLREVEAFVALLRKFAGTVRHLFVPTWSRTISSPTYGMLDWTPGLGLSHLLARMNLALGEGLADLPNVHVLDSDSWLRSDTILSHMPKMWFAAKVPYGNAVFQAAATNIGAAVTGLAGRSRRLLVVDLDNTLWGGVIGETGWQGIVLGGHHHVGEAYAAFQAALKALSNRGIQLAIVSKNDESIALEALDNHPEMRLRRKDFASWRINWEDKAANIAAIAAEVNLGLASVVFLDDHPAERARVREALPEVMVPEWPEDPAQYVSALWNLRCFETPTLNSVDRHRTAMYTTERERRTSVQSVGSIEDWLRTLDLVVSVESLSATNLPRAAQLLNKTNQLNLTTRRLTEKELVAWAAEEHHRFVTFSVRDRFGDYGLVGLLGIACGSGQAQIVDFVLSCRVMGRKVEEAMLHVASRIASEFGSTVLRARLVPTDRNRPTRDILENSLLRPIDAATFIWDESHVYPKPDTINLEQAKSLSAVS